MTTTMDLLTALRAHLAEFELPAIASVHMSAALSAPQGTVQLTCHEPSAIAQGLLAWADTLTQVTAQAWRAPRGDFWRAFGQQTMDDLPVVATFGGSLLNAGSNRIALTHTDVWYSPDLHMDLSVVRNTPQLGEVTLQVTNLVRGEPDSSWFSVPCWIRSREWFNPIARV